MINTSASVIEIGKNVKLDGEPLALHEGEVIGSEVRADRMNKYVTYKCVYQVNKRDDGSSTPPS
jgi:hypothetical protein